MSDFWNKTRAKKMNNFLESEEYSKFKQKVKTAKDKTKHELKILKEDTKKRLSEVISGRLSDMIYIAPRIIIMAYPISDEDAPGIGKTREEVISDYLDQHHRGHFLIINISDKHYDTSIFNDCVVEFFFPGYSAPPLGVLFKISWTVESWLSADPLNVVLIHCLNGRGRTITTTACFLAWSGLAPSAQYGLEYISEKRNESSMSLTVPTQRRYIHYFDKVLNGIHPSNSSLILKSLLIYNNPLSNLKKTPEIRIYKSGTKLATLCNAKVENKCCKYETDLFLQGNILLRCTQVLEDGRPVTLFRCGFHTGFIDNNLLILPVYKLDGPLKDQNIKFPQNFSVELHFDNYSLTDQDQSPSTDASDIYEQVLTSNKSFWDEVNERKLKRKPLEKGELNDLVIGSEKKKNFLKDIEVVEKEYGMSSPLKKSNNNNNNRIVSPLRPGEERLPNDTSTDKDDDDEDSEEEEELFFNKKYTPQKNKSTPSVILIDSSNDNDNDAGNNNNNNIKKNKKKSRNPDDIDYNNNNESIPPPPSSSTTTTTTNTIQSEEDNQLFDLLLGNAPINNILTDEVINQKIADDNNNDLFNDSNNENSEYMERLLPSINQSKYEDIINKTLTPHDNNNNNNNNDNNNDNNDSLFQIDSNTPSPVKDQPIIDIDIDTSIPTTTATGNNNNENDGNNGENNNDNFSLFEDSPNHIEQQQQQQQQQSEEPPPPAIEQDTNKEKEGDNEEDIQISKKGSADSFSIDNIMSELDIPMGDSRANSSDFNLDDIENEINASLKDI